MAQKVDVETKTIFPLEHKELIRFRIWSGGVYRFGLWMVALAALCPLVSSQGMCDGIAKYTRGQSDPRSCLAFFEKYLNGAEAVDDCPEGLCECGTQGRFQMNGSSEVEITKNVCGPFGVHAINCSYHPYGEYSLADIEKMQAAEVNDFKDGYNQHLDSHLGIWVSDLHSTMDKLNKDKVPHYAMTWSQGSNSYYSVMTVPCSGFYIEFLSEKATGIPASQFHETNEIRYDFANYSHPEQQFKPIKVSRATTKIDEMINFYTNVIGGTLERNVTEDGVHIAWVLLNGAPKVLLQFVNRPASASAKFTVHDLEMYVNEVHNEFVRSPTCGFDQFADHHWCYDHRTNGETLSSVAEKLTAGGHKYRWFYVNIYGGYQIYAFDPSGWSIQLNWTPGNDIPIQVPSYSAACKSNDGCYGQGLCNEEHFTPF